MEYYQVALTALAEDTFNREITPLEDIGDSYPKFLLTLDPGQNIHNGVKCINALDWMLAE